MSRNWTYVEWNQGENVRWRNIYPGGRVLEGQSTPLQIFADSQDVETGLQTL